MINRLVVVTAMFLAGVSLGIGPARAEHLERDVCPVEPTREFPDGFKLPIDHQAEICRTASAQWKDKHVGGWGGGDCPAGHKGRVPVILFHGNTTDAWFWRTQSETSDGTITNVRRYLIDAGYCASEIWALSYSGDASPRGAYASGYTTSNDVNAEEVYQFMLSVLRFTGSPQIDVVGHSLGVTVVRKAMFIHRGDPTATNPYHFVRRAVMIAGANHGNTGCRGGYLTHDSHVCEETDPDGPWIDELNSIGESPGPTKWMSICECLGADQTYEGPDIESPLMAGSVQVRLPGTPHATLARGTVALTRYVPFLVEGSVLQTAPKPVVKAARHSRERLPATGVGTPFGVALLLVGLGGAGAAWLVRRDRRTP